MIYTKLYIIYDTYRYEQKSERYASSTKLHFLSDICYISKFNFLNIRERKSKKAETPKIISIKINSMLHEDLV